MNATQSDTTVVSYPLWRKGDLDGFFGLAVDNLVQVLLIIDLCSFAAGLPDALIYHRILPAVAVSLLIGNLFYAWQARRVARRDGNATCTALPYGINTPSLIAFVLFVMAPVYRTTGDADLAWKAGVFACLVSGLIEFTGAFVAEPLRRATPRAALLGVLAGVGLTFLAGDFLFRMYTHPMIALPPLAFILIAYFARARLPLGLPGGMIAVLFGTAAAWVMSALGAANFGGVAMSADAVRTSANHIGWTLPVFSGAQLADVFSHKELLTAFLSVSIPMGVINVLASLQNIESAEAGGDHFDTRSSLAVNGAGSIVGGLFGSCFPTTIYIGHPGWKALGAGAGYSIANGLFFTIIYLLGLGALVRSLIPVDAGAAIVMYIGLMITAQAFRTTPRNHAPAVALSLVPAVAAMLVIAVSNYMIDANGARTLADLVREPTPASTTLPGLLAVTGANSAWIIVTLILTAVAANVADRKLGVAAVWSGVGAVLTLVGLMHAYRLDGNVVHAFYLWQADEGDAVVYRAFPIAIGYAVCAVVFVLLRSHVNSDALQPNTEDAMEREL